MEAGSLWSLEAVESGSLEAVEAGSLGSVGWKPQDIHRETDASGRRDAQDLREAQTVRGRRRNCGVGAQNLRGSPPFGA